VSRCGHIDVDKNCTGLLVVFFPFYLLRGGLGISERVNLQVVEVIGLVTVWSIEGIEHHLVLPVIGHIVIVRVPGSRPSSGPLRVVLVLDPSPCGPKATEEDDVDIGHSALSPQGPPKAAGGSRELEVAARLLPEAVLKAGWPCCTKGRRVRQRPPVEPGSPRSPRLPRDCSQRLH
jgi:hypothetical protein